MTRDRKVTLRVSQKTALKRNQFLAIRGVLEELGLELADPGKGGPEVSQLSCKEHSCVGFSDGGPSDDCVALHSKCGTEACKEQSCDRHTCETEACSEQGKCQSHHCTGTHTTSSEIMAMMAKESKSFGLLLEAQRKIDAQGISLSFDTI